MVHPAGNATAAENVSEAGLPEKKDDVSMDHSENMPAFPTGGHTLSPLINDTKRAKYDETIDMETPSTSSYVPASKTESVRMEVEEEPEIIEASLDVQFLTEKYANTNFQKRFQIGERHAILFSLNNSQPMSHEEEMKDSFFDLTVNDIKVLLRDLRTQSQELENAPLMTAKMRELEHDNQTLLKLNRYKTTVIRIQFANRLVLQGIFLPSDSVQQVMDFVRGFLNDPNMEFDLCKNSNYIFDF